MESGIGGMRWTMDVEKFPAVSSRVTQLGDILLVSYREFAAMSLQVSLLLFKLRYLFIYIYIFSFSCMFFLHMRSVSSFGLSFLFFFFFLYQTPRVVKSKSFH